MLSLFIYNKYFVIRNNFPEIGSALCVHHSKNKQKVMGLAHSIVSNSGYVLLNMQTLGRIFKNILKILISKEKQEKLKVFVS